MGCRRSIASTSAASPVYACGQSATEDRTDLTVQLHHAACDGIGTMRFIEELLLSYAQQIGVTGLPPLPPLQPEKLRGRGRFGLNAWKFIRILGRQAVGLLGVWQFAVHRSDADSRRRFSAGGRDASRDLPDDIDP